jgi:hypothetical protein
MTGTAWFLVPDLVQPTGGVRGLYRFVDHLVASGIPASVVHEERGFRCSWFESDTPVTWLDDVVLGRGDLLAVPEISVSTVAQLYQDTPMVVVNQNQYLTFQYCGLPPSPSPNVLPDTVVAIIVGSEDGRDYAKLAFPEVPVERVHYGTDTSVFHPPEHPKEQAIAFMPRKRVEDIVQILRILERRRSLDGWRLYPINALVEPAPADILRRSAVFLSLNQQEGFGSPPVEAMASGCVVVGYAGRGGREYMRPEISFPVDEGAIADFVRAVEHVITEWENGERFTELTERAAKFVETEYSPARERDDFARIFSEALTRVEDVMPGARTLRRRPSA